MNLKDLDPNEVEVIESPKAESKKLNLADVEPNDIENLTEVDSAVLGATQGATLGFADEIYGGVAGAVDTAKDLVKGDAKIDQLLYNLSNRYGERKEEAQDLFDRAETANPKSYMAGDVAGSIGSGIVSGGAGAAKLLGSAARSGGLLSTLGRIGKGAVSSGSGASSVLARAAGQTVGTGAALSAGRAAGDQDDISQIPEDALKAGAVGGAGGLLTPVGIGAVTRAAGKVGSLTKGGLERLYPSSELGTKSAEITRKGYDVLASGGYEKLSRQAQSELLENLRPLMRSSKKELDTSMNKVMDRIKAVKAPKELPKELKQQSQKLDDLLKSGTITEADTVRSIREAKKGIDFFRKDLVKVNPKAAQDKAVDKALLELEKKQNRLTAQAAETSTGINFTPPKVDMDLGTVTSFETNTGRVFSAPIKGGEFSPIEVLKKQGNIKELTFEQIDGMIKNVDDILAKNQAPAVKKQVGDVRKLLKNAKDQILEGKSEKVAYDELMDKYGARRQLQETLGVDLTSEVLNDKEVLDVVGKLTRDVTSKVNFFDSFSKRLNEFTGEEARKLAKNITDISEALSLTTKGRSTFGLNPMGTGDAISVRIGALIGALQRVGDKTRDSLIGKSAKSASKMIDKIQPSFQAGVRSGKSFTNKDSNEDVSNVIDGIERSNDPAYQAFKPQLESIRNISNDREREIMFYALRQQPAFKEMLKRISKKK